MVDVGRLDGLRAGLPGMGVIGGHLIANFERGDGPSPAGDGDQGAGGEVAQGVMRMKVGCLPRKTLCDFKEA